MVQLLLHSVISLYEAILVSISQIKIRISVRFHIVPHLPAVIEESTLRVKGKRSYFNRLFVHGEISFIELPSSAQNLRGERILPLCRLWEILVVLMVVWSEVFIFTQIPSTAISFSFVCWLPVVVAGVGVVGSVMVHCWILDRWPMRQINYTGAYSDVLRLWQSYSSFSEKTKQSVLIAVLF